MKPFHTNFRRSQQRLRSFFMFLFLFATLATLSACVDNSNDNSNGEQTGEVTIGLTDAPGDFTTYTVERGVADSLLADI